MKILTGDIGGTNTRLAICELDETCIRVTGHQTFPSQDYPSLQDIIDDYPDTSGIEAAAFGVAGPVQQGVSRTTNLPWEISRRRLAERLGTDQTYLLNDLEALAWGIAALEPVEMVSLQTGQPGQAGNQAVIAAGTGLGQAGLFFDGRQHIPFATEGGHGDFSATTEREYHLFRQLKTRYGHVSWERLVSGQGLVNLYSFIIEDAGQSPPDWLSEEDPPPAAIISSRGLDGSDAQCVEALSWFVELYGREAGNFALKTKATGGLFIGGGIAPKILPALQDGTFLRAFLDKGRMRPLVESMPVLVIRSEQVTLKGLARHADYSRPT